MSAITINQLNPDEWQKYKDIRLEALKINPTAFANTYEDVLTHSDEKWKEQLEQSQKKDGLIILFAMDGDRVVGMNAFHWANKPVTKHIAQIFGVFISPDYRGKGIGKLLMDGIISEIKKNSQFIKITLGVNAENTSALKLYESLGLKVVGKHEKELKFGDKLCDELLMEKIFEVNHGDCPS